jgi:hypothetical protein
MCVIVVDMDDMSLPNMCEWVEDGVEGGLWVDCTGERAWGSALVFVHSISLFRG